MGQIRCVNSSKLRPIFEVIEHTIYRAIVVSTSKDWEAKSLDFLTLRVILSAIEQEVLRCLEFDFFLGRFFALNQPITLKSVP